MKAGCFIEEYMHLKALNSLDAAIFALRNLEQNPLFSTIFMPMIIYGGFGQGFQPLEERFILLFDPDAKIVVNGYDFEIYKIVDPINWNMPSFFNLRDLNSKKIIDTFLYSENFKLTDRENNVIGYARQLKRNLKNNNFTSPSILLDS